MPGAQKRFDMSGELKSSVYNAVLYHHLYHKNAFLFQIMAAAMTLFFLVPFLMANWGRSDTATIWGGIAVVLVFDLFFVFIAPRLAVRSHISLGHFLEDDESLHITCWLTEDGYRYIDADHDERFIPWKSMRKWAVVDDILCILTNTEDIYPIFLTQLNVFDRKTVLDMFQQHPKIKQL